MPGFVCCLYNLVDRWLRIAGKTAIIADKVSLIADKTAIIADKLPLIADKTAHFAVTLISNTLSYYLLLFIKLWMCFF